LHRDHRVCCLPQYVILVSTTYLSSDLTFVTAASSFAVKYGSLFLSISGSYCAAPALSTWNANNSAPHIRRASAIAIGFIMTNSGGILVTWLFGSLSPPPKYTKATITLIAFSVGTVVVSGLNVLYLRSQNAKKAEARKRLGTVENEREQLGSALGDRSAWFAYSL
jgi:hypothetical protein